MNLLHIDSSILGDNSVSRKISAALVGRVRRTDPGVTVTYRDLAAVPLAPLSGAYLAGLASAAPHDDALTHDLALGTAVMDEFLAADIVVIGAPMYNFAIPAQLKAWIDRIVVAGKTFRYTETGPLGLATGKRVLIAIARGGVYSGQSPMVAFDFQEPYLRSVLGFIGITDIEVVRAEGVALGPNEREQALSGALQAAAAA